MLDAGSSHTPEWPLDAPQHTWCHGAVMPLWVPSSAQKLTRQLLVWWLLMDAAQSLPVVALECKELPCL